MTGCGFRATGSSRGTFMRQDSHRTAKPGRRGGLIAADDSSDPRGPVVTIMHSPLSQSLSFDSARDSFAAHHASGRFRLFRENLNTSIRRFDKAYGEVNQKFCFLFLLFSKDLHSLLHFISW